MKRTIHILVGLLLASDVAFAGDFEDGVAAYTKGDYAIAVSNLTQAAEQGDARAQTVLGAMYDVGEGVPKDDEQAIYWYTKAADQGNASAQNGLGAMYSNGKGVPKDEKQAVYWFTKAAEQGHVFAQNGLGAIYSNGKGVPKDEKQAVYWFTKAAEQGYALGQYNLGWVYGDGAGVPKDDGQAIYWYTKASEQGNIFAQINLGGMFYDGVGVPKDYVQAYKWWNLAAARGDEDARYNLGFVEQLMTPEQIAEAQRLAREFKPGNQTAQVPQQTPKLAPRRTTESPRLVGTGTGFYVSAMGHVLTNEHVISECSFVEVEPVGKPSLAVTVVASDTRNDLALIHSKERGFRYSQFRSGSVRQGEDVVVYGFPLLGALASTGNATTGNVTALSGMADDSRMLQISAPVQPGNSGGPLMDMSGAIVGVVVAKLNAAKVMEVTGDIPQNVNFALKANVAKSFLESHGIEYESVPKGRELSVPDVVDVARSISVQVLCFQ